MAILHAERPLVFVAASERGRCVRGYTEKHPDVVIILPVEYAELDTHHQKVEQHAYLRPCPARYARLVCNDDIRNISRDKRPLQTLNDGNDLQNKIELWFGGHYLGTSSAGCILTPIHHIHNHIFCTCLAEFFQPCMAGMDKKRATVYRRPLKLNIWLIVIVSFPAMTFSTSRPVILASGFVPMAFLLPSPPVSLDHVVRHTLMPRGDAAVCGRHVDQGARHPSGSDCPPWPVITVRDIPPSPMRSIPESVIEENIHLDIRRIVHIRTGYHDQGRWCRNYQTGQRDVDIDVYLGITCYRSRETEHQTQGAYSESTQ